MKPQPIKGKMPILVALLILALSSMCLLGRCSRSNGHQTSSQFNRPSGDTLVVAIEISPTGYAFNGDSAAGFDYEMLRYIAAAHNIPVVFHPFVPMEYALKGLDKGDFDMVVATIPASSKLQGNIDISTQVSLSNLQSWIVRGDKEALRDSLNNWINQFKETPDYNRLIEKYLK